MTARTFDELFEPQLRLSLETSQGGWYSVLDQHGRLYFPPTQNVETCLRFLHAMRERGHAVIDDASVERATWHSVRVPDALSEREPSAVAPAGGDRATSPSRSESASNVYPIRKGA